MVIVADGAHSPLREALFGGCSVRRSLACVADVKSVVNFFPSPVFVFVIIFDKTRISIDTKQHVPMANLDDSTKRRNCIQR